MDKLSDLQERNNDPEAYRQRLIDANKEEPQPQSVAPEKPGIDYIKILTDAAIRNPKEVNEFMDEYVGKEGKALLIDGIKQSNPAYAHIVDRIFPTSHNNGNASRNLKDASGRDFDDSNSLDDNDPDKSYDIPDTEILDEVRAFSTSLHLTGYGWSAISDQIFRKYDIDWNPLKIKDIVLKNLAWRNRDIQEKKTAIPDPVPQPQSQPQPEPHRGYIRRLWRTIW
ncbi:MAG: hypothetical protein L6282_01890 [Candidatus Methanoperedenaceae archaeon]|nr:hypothetical protein [Candidatus Methanoperedenaceae archaeon]